MTTEPPHPPPSPDPGSPPTGPGNPPVPTIATDPANVAAREGYLHRGAVAFDQFVNVLTDGNPDETISSRMQRWRDEETGLKQEIGTAVSKALDVLQANHGVIAETADKERAQAVEQIEEKALRENQ